MRTSWVPHLLAIGFWWSLSKDLARLHVWVHRDFTIITPEFLFHAPWIHPKFRHPLDTEEMCRVSNAQGFAKALCEIGQGGHGQHVTCRPPI